MRGYNAPIRSAGNKTVNGELRVGSADKVTDDGVFRAGFRPVEHSRTDVEDFGPGHLSEDVVAMRMSLLTCLVSCFCLRPSAGMRVSTDETRGVQARVRQVDVVLDLDDDGEFADADINNSFGESFVDARKRRAVIVEVVRRGLLDGGRVGRKVQLDPGLGSSARHERARHGLEGDLLPSGMVTLKKEMRRGQSGMTAERKLLNRREPPKAIAWARSFA